ncbi:alpha/beta hydrolase fold domain-containing protein [Calidithermus chliarophilus]|uniref:alpha/beta hydrolase fold domain-containing protein n=1 Tax=Calidithermus chliarophilus TaxID=52023 RepID=UPI00041B4E90|nr:alpha/beta hydrolase fold domain-containing protein [Calidithermus chliarophilus]
MPFTPPPGLELIPDLPYGEQAGRAHLIDVLRPTHRAARPVPAILFLHGGGWHVFGKYPEINAFLARAGYVTFSSNYRYSHEAPFPAQLEDARAAVAWVRAHAARWGVDPGRVGVWGISAGAHLAALLGALGEVQAVVDVCGPADFFDPGWRAELQDPQGLVSRLLGARAGEVAHLAAQASPVCRVSPLSAPFLIVHGARDAQVPLSQAEALHAALLEVDVPSELWVIPEGDHFINETHLPQIEARVLEFFRETLGDPL